MDEFGQIACGVDIHVEAMDIFISACDFCKSMVDKSRLSDSSWGDEDDVALVVQGAK